MITREEIAEIIYEGWKTVEFGLARAPKWKDLDKKTADGFRAISDRLLARLRPAFDRLKHLEAADKADPYESRQELCRTIENLREGTAKWRETCDALRASLARKDEALRACVEALEQAHACATYDNLVSILRSVMGLVRGASSASSSPRLARRV